MQKKISTHAVEFLVLDEADKLFEMGFVEQIDAIVHACDNPDDNDDDDDKKKKKKKKKKKESKKDAIKDIAYYKIPVSFVIDGNFIGYIKFKRALSLSNKMLNFDKESIKVVKGDSTGTIKVSGTLTIVGLADEFY